MWQIYHFKVQISRQTRWLNGQGYLVAGLMTKVLSWDPQDGETTSISLLFSTSAHQNNWAVWKCKSSKQILQNNPVQQTKWKGVWREKQEKVAAKINSKDQCYSGPCSCIAHFLASLTRSGDNYPVHSETFWRDSASSPPLLWHKKPRHLQLHICVS